MRRPLAKCNAETLLCMADLSDVSRELLVMVLNKKSALVCDRGWMGRSCGTVRLTSIHHPQIVEEALTRLRAFSHMTFYSTLSYVESY
jgi:hypothetical protein